MPLLVPESRKLLLSISAPLALVVASSLGKLFLCEDTLAVGISRFLFHLLLVTPEEEGRVPQESQLKKFDLGWSALGHVLTIK
jgi:hypothetical protein